MTTTAGQPNQRHPRGIITDTLGLRLAVIVTAASVSDNAIGNDLLDQATTAHPTLTKTWVDAGFKVKTVEHGAALGVDVEIVTKGPRVNGLSVVKRRWVVERTIGWLMQHRRLVRDHETRPRNSANTISGQRNRACSVQPTTRSPEETAGSPPSTSGRHSTFILLDAAERRPARTGCTIRAVTRICTCICACTP